MDQLYHKYKDREIVFIIPLLLLNLGKIVGHFFWRLTSGWGFPQSTDSKWYLDYAHTLMVNCKVGLHMNDILYLGYNVLLTLLLAVFKDPVAVLFIQAVTASFSVILVYKIARILFNRVTAILASLFYYHLYDITLWSTYILSESFFISLLLLCVYFLLMALESDKKKFKVLFGVTSLYMLIFRPTGIVTMLFILAYVMIRRNTISAVAYSKQHSLVIGGCFSAFVATCFFLYAGGKLDMFITSLQLNVKMVLYNIYAKGWIYDKPTAYDYFFKPDYTINVFNSLSLSFFINNWDHVFTLYGKRMIAFLGKWVWEIDLKSLSGIIQFVSDALPTVLFLTGTIAAIVNRQFRRASILWLIILSVFSFCMLVFIDWMYRYRSPATPFIAIVAAYGAERILHSAALLRNKYKGRLVYGKKKNANCNSGV